MSSLLSGSFECLRPSASTAVAPVCEMHGTK